MPTYRTSRKMDPRLGYRGDDSSRLSSLTDAVFGIAITLLIFNLNNPNSFQELMLFAKTLPAFVLSIAFLVLIWLEHRDFTELFGLRDVWLVVLNTLFIAIVICLVYPLRFLSLFLTNLYFNLDMEVRIGAHEMPLIMIYYGAAVASLYLIIMLFYARAKSLRYKLQLNEFELFTIRWQRIRLAILLVVPLLSIVVVAFIRGHNPVWASAIGGMCYLLMSPGMGWWAYAYGKKSKGFRPPQDQKTE